MIIFLDIDGVLVTLADHYPTFNKKSVDALNKFCEKTNAKIVVSSTWRMGQTIQSMNARLKKEGVIAEVIGLAPYHLDDIRGNEIKEWLDKYSEETGVNPEYLVIDDEIGDIIKYIPRERIVYVRNGFLRGGLQDEHLEHFMPS